METKYTQIRPEDMFTVVVERIIKHDTREKMHYEYKFRIDVRKTPNDFINLFAELLSRHGKRTADFYAKLMGVNDGRRLIAALFVITGAGIYEWTDVLAAKVSEVLLRETTLSIGEIASAAGWSWASSSSAIFSRWFSARYKCSPVEWRERNRG